MVFGLDLFMRKSILLFLLLAASGMPWSCSKLENPSPSANEYRNTVFVRWNELFLKLDRYSSGYRPVPAARALGYLGLAAYQCCLGGMPEYNSMAGQLPTLGNLPSPDLEQLYNWPIAVNESYAFLLTRFYFTIENNNPSLFKEIDQLREKLETELTDGVPFDASKRSVELGRAIANAIYEWESVDEAGHNAFLDPRPIGYVEPSGTSEWKPTPPDFSKASFPYWGNVRTFALPDEERLAKAPIPFSELPGSLFFFQAHEAYNFVNLINSSNPSEQQESLETRWQAQFWSDDIEGLTFSSPGHMISIANQIVVAERLDLAQSAELYAKIGMALSDAGVALWQSKYYYNLERPVSYIRRVLPGSYPLSESWLTALKDFDKNITGLTPSSPAYPSAHGGFSGAASKILSSIFEYNSKQPGTYLFTDYSHQNRTEFKGTPRTFFSFKEMADDCAYSRISLGVNYRMACAEGLRLGDLAAQRVLELKWKK